MGDSRIPDLLEFPCDYEFKAFGPNDGERGFARRVREAVAQSAPVGEDSIRRRASSRGGYQCVSVVVRLHGESQLKAIYAALQEIEELKFLL